jgi:hypothetical protein
MKLMNKLALCSAFLLQFNLIWSQNQTDTLSQVFPENALPFTIQLDVANFSLPTGLQSFASAIYNGKWVILAGRTNGLHGFDNVGNNFPPSFQNTTVYVIDPATGISWSRALNDRSGLTQAEIDSLSVTASQSFQKGNLLYFVGGYGINTATNTMETKGILTVIDLVKLVGWVINGTPLAKCAIRQVFHPFLTVTGGFLFQANDHQPMLLMLGQNFMGLYTDSSNGLYTRQIRPFWIIAHKNELSILAQPSEVTIPDYRRRDLNIVPTIHNNKFDYTAFAGVFTPDTGVWTVPITIFADGSSFQPDPNDPNTFKQAMNHYNCPAFGLYSVGKKEMFVVFPGGISFGYFSGGTFQTDAEFPFINQITTVKIDRRRQYTQYLMNNEYPFLVSTGSNPGNQLLFGAEAVFFPKDGVPVFANGVFQLDALPKTPTVIGYIAGGIMSTLPNTNTSADSTASPYVFTVTLVPKDPS